MASGMCSVFGEFKQLMKSVQNLTDGQALVGPLDYNEEVELNQFSLAVTPNEGYYKGATCNFTVTIPDDYPNSPPAVTCRNQIYHPNIDYYEYSTEFDSNICVNMLDSDWSASVGLDGAVLAVLFLFHHPNVDDSLNQMIGSGLPENEFAEIVERACRGEEIDGVVYDNLFCSSGDSDVKKAGLEEVKDEKNTMGDVSEEKDEEKKMEGGVHSTAVNSEVKDGEKKIEDGAPSTAVVSTERDGEKKIEDGPPSSTIVSTEKHEDDNMEDGSSSVDIVGPGKDKENQIEAAISSENLIIALKDAEVNGSTTTALDLVEEFEKCNLTHSQEQSASRLDGEVSVHPRSVKKKNIFQSLFSFIKSRLTPRTGKYNVYCTDDNDGL